MLNEGRDPKREVAILGVVHPLKSIGGSTAQVYTAKVNNGDDSGTAAGRLQCSTLVGFTLHCPT